LDPLARGYYIGYSQRVAEKHLLQQDYLRRRIELKTDEARNTKDRVILASTISDLQDSNERLAGIIHQQTLERRLQEEELLAYKLRRSLF